MQRWKLDFKDPGWWVVFHSIGSVGFWNQPPDHPHSLHFVSTLGAARCGQTQTSLDGTDKKHTALFRSTP